MFERIKHMLIKEIIQIFRDPRMRFVIFIPPIFQLIIFGYAATTDVKHIAMGVYDLDQSQASRELVSRFVESGYFDIEKYIDHGNQMNDLIDHDDVQTILRLNSGFEEDLLAGKTVRVQLIVDGTDSNTAGIIFNYAAKIAQEFSSEILGDRFQRLNGFAAKPGLIELQMRSWFNENLESRNFYIPGVIVIIVSLMSLMLTSMAVVREKEIGTIEQIMVTPITPVEFILGKTLPFALISFIDVILIVTVAFFWFRIPIRGSLLLLFLCTALYLMSTLGIGLFISTICQTQQQAMMSTFFFFFPAILLSGFMFPIANMPIVIQWLTYLNPLRYFLAIIRGIFLKGVGFRILWPQMIALLIMGIITLMLASKRFHKTLS